MLTVRLLGAVIVLLCVWVGSARAMPPPTPQCLYLPLDVSSGVAFGRGEPRPYALRARLSPSKGFGEAGSVRIGAEFVGLYENPIWVSGIGATVSVRVWSLPLKELSLFIVADHMWWQGDRPSSGVALLVDLDGLYRAGLRLDRDWFEESTIVQGTVGLDVPTLLKVLRGHRRSGVVLPPE